MTNYKEILRLAALGIQKQDIAASCQCSRNTVRNVLNAAQERSITWAMARDCTNEALRQMLFPASGGGYVYRIRGCMAALTSIAQMRVICRRITKNIYSGTETDLSVGLNRLVTIPPLWCVIFLRCTKWSSRDISPVWRC